MNEVKSNAANLVNIGDLVEIEIQDGLLIETSRIILKVREADPFNECIMGICVCSNDPMFKVGRYYECSILRWSIYKFVRIL